MAKKSFIIYQNWAKLFENLEDDKAGMLIKAICANANGKEVVVEDASINAIYQMIADKITEDSEKYAEVSQARRESAKKRWDDTKQCKSIQKDANAKKSIQKDYDTETETDTDTVTVNETDNVSPTEIKEKDSPTESRKRKPLKKKCGAFGHVLLSDRDIELLYQNHGEMETQTAIDYLDAYIEEKGYKSKNHKMTLERWVFDAVKKKGHGDNRASNITPFNPTEYLLNQIREEEERRGQVGNGEDHNSNNSGVSGLFS